MDLIAIGVFGSMACQWSTVYGLSRGSLRTRLGYGEIKLWAPPLKVANLRMSLGINSRLSLMKSTS